MGGSTAFSFHNRRDVARAWRGPFVLLLRVIVSFRFFPIYAYSYNKKKTSMMLPLQLPPLSILRRHAPHNLTESSPQSSAMSFSWSKIKVVVCLYMHRSCRVPCIQSCPGFVKIKSLDSKW